MSDLNHYVFPEAMLRKAVISRLVVGCFTPDTHGTNQRWPFTDTETHWIKRVSKGWTITGMIKNSKLAPAVRRVEEQGQTYVAIMFRDPDGFDVWWHFPDYPWVFFTS